MRENFAKKKKNIRKTKNSPTSINQPKRVRIKLFFVHLNFLIN